MSQGRSRFSSALLETASVVFAVLVALAANQWAEDKENRKRADRAFALIISEIETNRDEIAADTTVIDSLIVYLTERARADDDEGTSINYPNALISSSAWEAARLGQATQFFDLEVVASISQLYQVQDLVARSQQGLVDLIMGATEFRLTVESDADAAAVFRSRVVMVGGLRKSLLLAYARFLDQHGPGGPTGRP